MPQETNLNVAPYFDDFDRESNYVKILFKPGTPVQARELTGIQSVLQDQIEKFGSHVFKDGTSVTGGGVRWNPGFHTVRIQQSNEGIDVNSYLSDLKNQVVIGSVSGVKAKIKAFIKNDDAYILYVSYLNTGGEDNQRFVSSESLLLDNKVLTTRSDGLVFQPGEPLAQVTPIDSTFVGCGAQLSSGIYFIRGYFVEIEEQIISINPFTTDVNAKIGLKVSETIVSPNMDSSLNDNAAGYSNYTAPGADRLHIEIELIALPITEDKPVDFIELMEIRSGSIASVSNSNTQYNELSEEFARRTYDESGNYYVNPFSIIAKNTLNNYEGNNGIFSSDQITYNNNVPSDDLGTYKISPGKAYIDGYEVETIVPGFLDFNKPRTTKTLENQSINYVTGPTFTLNRVSGSPQIGIGTDYTVSLRDQRIGAAVTTAAGSEIGLARVYDFALESGSYDAANSNINEWDIALYDIQTYTNITLNAATTLAVPTHIKGKSSGATGYLRYEVNSGTAVTAYNTKGKFITGEQFIFNGVESGNISVGSTSYSTSDIKSIHGTVGTANTFSGDVKQSSLVNIGQVKITDPPTAGASAGISTVTFTDPNKFFIGIATVGNIVEYTNSGLNTTSYAKIETVSQRSLTISGVTTVTGICEGGLPSTAINPSNFKILTSQFQSSTDNNLYTTLPNKNISNVDLTRSSIVIKKQFDVNITNNSTGVINSGSSDETFLPFDEERYVLMRTGNGVDDFGGTESLSSDKINFNTGSTQITINGLGSNSAAKLIATLRKINVTEKIKEIQKINTLTVVGSANSTSGIGATTLNDGLSYNNVYGTRVQDDEISLNVPDVMKIHGIFESSNSSDPLLPKATLVSINSSTGKTGDLLIGEKFVGNTSKFTGIYVSKNDDSNINYIALNDLNLQEGEIITFQESGISATLSALTIGSNNIVDEFTLDNGQRDTIYDYSRLIRKPGYDTPTKKLTIVFESAYFSSSDTGDVTTVSSYNDFDYKDLPKINDDRVSDIIDIRPRVSDFSGTSYSPFEFLGRSFTADGNSAKNILASDESSVLDYSYYLPRLDKIYLTRDGVFQLINGVPSDNPEWPNNIDGSLEVASIKLPAYLYDINDVSISLANYKRYQMRDISRLENRIENLEFYTSLSLLEDKTFNTQITDVDGLNRFKSGFFVDDFSNTDNQIKKTIVKNSIDYQNGELRPSHYTTELDLKLDLNSSNGIRKTGRVLTLDYDSVKFIQQSFASRVENVTPYLVNYYSGTIDLLPSSDIWIDQVELTAANEDLTTYTQSTEELSASEFDSRSGYGPVTWGNWNNNWSGNSGTATRTGTKQLVRETFSTRNEGPKVIDTQIISNLRSRNLKFDAKGLKPQTSIYAFLDGQDINNYIVPKLLEISMTTGTFAVGETVVGTNSNGDELIRFKVAQSNHRSGPIDDPTSIYKANPYYQFTPLYLGLSILVDNIVPTQSNTANTDSSLAGEVIRVPELYSSTSSILNVDITSLAEKSDNTYHGYVEKGIKLVGQTSNAQATVSDVRLRSDSTGSLIGSFFIPNPNNTSSPKFESGKKVFRLTSNKLNSQIPGNVTTDATQVFESTGTLETVQSTIISVKNIHTDILTRTETKSISRGGGGGGGSSSNNNNTGGETTTHKVITCNIPIGTDLTGHFAGSKTVEQTVDTTGTVVSETVVKIDDPVNDAYLAAFGRNADAGGKLYWTKQVESQGVDMSDSAAVQAAVEVHLNASTEGQDVAAGKQKTVNEYIADKKESSMADGSWNEGTFGGPTKSGTYQLISEMDPDCPAGGDPLAQTFRVEASSGVYITEADVYLASKDEFLPLVVQLRTVKLGLPTTEIIPFGEVVIDPEDVNVSEDATVPTKVTFPSPVYLPGGQTYALVLLSISNDYTAWISRMGEVDIQSVDNPESEQVIISSQPTLGSLFKSQNGETWNASQYEDLKFTLYKAVFNTQEGNINFTNPHLVTQSDDIPPLLKDSFRISSNKIRVGFNTTISDTGITLGNIVQQMGSNATGRYVGYAGTATGNLTISNPGVGYTPSSGSETYNHVPMVTQTGSGRNGTLNMTITNGVAVAATVVNGGSGYEIGDVVGVSTVGLTSLGKDIQFSIASLTGTNEWVLDNVQGEFATGVGKTFQYVTGAGTTILNYAAGGNVWLSGSPVTVTDGLHIKVNQKNHGMHSTQNVVTLNDVQSDVPATTLSSDYDSTSTGSIIVNDGTNFSEFENVSVATTNLGYVKVGSEILSYSGVSENTLTGVTRGVDSTQTLSHSEGDFVHKYELNGISLRRINKDHNLADSTVSESIGLDHYNIKIDTSANGVDRSVGTSLPILHFNDSKSTGGNKILSTENIPFDIITPIIQNITPRGTNLTAQVRTVTGSSVDGSETPFQDKGFENISLVTDNYMSSPRIVASRINETTSLTTLPDNKSFTLNLSFTGGDLTVSPMVDLDRIGMIFTSNRVNNPISNFITDNRVNTLKDDPNAFVYASKPITLESGSTGIKIYLAGHINLTSDIRAFYAIPEEPNDELIYQPFPGYNNLLSTGQVIDPSKNDGLPDKALPKTDVIAYTSDQVVWKDYEFTIDDLPTFRHFSIKLVGTGTNQSQPPRIKDLRVIALA